MTSLLDRQLSPKWAVPDDVYLFTEFTPIDPKAATKYQVP